jgi:DNA-binding NtrC family response regulator
VLEQAAMRSDTQHLDAAQLERLLRDAGLTQIAPASSPSTQALATAAETSLLRPLGVQIAELEHRAIAAAMAATHGNKLATSRLLGIARATLYERLENPD